MVDFGIKRRNIGFFISISSFVLFLDIRTFASSSTAIDDIPIAMPVVFENEVDMLPVKSEDAAGKKPSWLNQYMQKRKHKLKHSRLENARWQGMIENFGNEYYFRTANAISECAAKMIEKHYDGIASFKKGASYLRDMQDIFRGFDEVQALLDRLKQDCLDDLRRFKKAKKKQEIKREKVLSSEDRQELDCYLAELFPQSPAVQNLLRRAFTSTLYCHHPKGMSVGGGFGFGGYAGFYRQTCRTALGRRYQFFHIQGGPGLGLLGAASTSLMGSEGQGDKQMSLQSTPHHFKLGVQQFMAAGIGFGLHTKAPLGQFKRLVQNAVEDQKNSSRVEMQISPAAGLGGFVGLGGSGEFRRVLRPDFSEMYEALQIYPCSR